MSKYEMNQTVRRYEVRLLEVETMPEDIPVDAIAEDAFQAAFKVIADALAGATGGHVWGDMMPDEVHALGNLFRGCVRSMAINAVALQEVQS